MYYIDSDKKALNHPFTNAYKTLIRYHSGSMIFGSFIMALIHFVRMFLEYLKRKRGDNGGCLRCIACIALCLIECCKTIWDMLSTNAYYLVAMFGLTFCSALQMGMELTSLGVTTLFYAIGNIMVNISIILVVAGSTFGTLAILDYNIVDKQRLIVCAILVLISTIISVLALSVYSVS